MATGVPWPSPAAVSALLDLVRAAEECDRASLGTGLVNGSVTTRALTEDSVEMEFLTDDPVAQPSPTGE